MRHQQLIFNRLTNIIAYAPSWTLLNGGANLFDKRWNCQCLYKPLVWACFTDRNTAMKWAVLGKLVQDGGFVCTTNSKIPYD
jgi:hypothetical protein